MKTTYILTMIGALALAGVPPFAGFFSKDEILLMALASGHDIIWLVCLIAAGLTAFYVFRMVFVVFYQSSKTKYAEEAHESPKIMTVPMSVLAIGSALAGFLGLPHLFGVHNQFHDWVVHSMSASYVEIGHISVEDQVLTMGASVAIALFGIFMAYKRFYTFDPKRQDVKGLYPKFASRKFYVDEIYDIFFVKGIRLFSTILNYLVEKFLIQGLMTAAVAVYKFGGGIFSMLQNGKAGHYALMMALGITVLTLILIRGLGI